MYSREKNYILIPIDGGKRKEPRTAQELAEMLGVTKTIIQNSVNRGAIVKGYKIVEAGFLEEFSDEWNWFRVDVRNDLKRRKRRLMQKGARR